MLGWVLSPDAAVLYDTLFANPDQTVAPHDPAVQELIEARLAYADWSDPTRLLLLPPEMAVTRVVTQRIRRWLDAAPDLDAAERVIGAYNRSTPKGTNDPAPLTTSTAHQHASTLMMASVRRELCLMQPYPSWMPDPIRDDSEASTKADTDALARGVTFRYLYDERILADAQFRTLALEEVAFGVQARVATNLPTWMAIADSTTALYLPDPNRTDGASTNQPGLVALLQMAFENAWAGARPLDATRGAADLTNQHREVLMLIIAGHPIGTIARLMKLDVKTVRRRTTDLCNHFHVNDRAALLTTALVTPINDR